VGFVLTKLIPYAKDRQSTMIAGVLKRRNSDPVIKQLRAEANGVIEFTVEKVDGDTGSFIRIANMRGAQSDLERRRLRRTPNLMVLDQPKTFYS